MEEEEEEERKQLDGQFSANKMNTDQLTRYYHLYQMRYGEVMSFKYRLCITLVIHANT